MKTALPGAAAVPPMEATQIFTHVNMRRDNLEKAVGRNKGDEITDALSKGNRVELRGFGAFSVKNRPARAGRNPRTGDTVHVEEKWVPFFKTGKELRERLNAD